MGESMMTTEEKIRKIEESRCIKDIDITRVIPDPDNSEGYFFVYYPVSLYKKAFIDILNFNASDVHIFYDRKMESGESYEADLLDKIEEYKCKGVLIYLDENALFDPFCLKVCRAMRKYGKSGFAVNFCKNEKGETISGAAAAEAVSGKLDSNALALYRIMFADEVTYVLGDAPFEQKLRALKGIVKPDVLEYAFGGDYAVVTGIRDIFVDKVIVPEYTEYQEKRYPVVAITKFAFANCAFLTSISFPKTLQEVGGYSDDVSRFEQDGCTFLNCRSLRRAIFPRSTYAIYTDVFENCTSLKEISAPGIEYLMTLGDGCKKLKNLKLSSNIIKIGDNYYVPATDTVLEIPKGAEVTGVRDALAECSGELEVPVRFRIGEALEGCDRVKKLIYNAEDAEIEEGDGVWLEANNMPELEVVEGKNVFGDVNIITEHCNKLNNIKCEGNDFGEINIDLRDCPVLESVEIIGEATEKDVYIAAYGCPMFRTLILPDNAGWIYLENFRDCFGVEELHIPKCYGMKIKSVGKAVKALIRREIELMRKDAEIETDEKEKSEILKNLHYEEWMYLGELRFKTLVLDSTECLKKLGVVASDDSILVNEGSFNDAIKQWSTQAQELGISKGKRRILHILAYFPLWIIYKIVGKIKEVRLKSESTRDKNIVTAKNIANKMPNLSTIYIKVAEPKFKIRGFRMTKSDRNGYTKYIRKM